MKKMINLRVPIEIKLKIKDKLFAIRFRIVKILNQNNLFNVIPFLNELIFQESVKYLLFQCLFPIIQ